MSSDIHTRIAQLLREADIEGFIAFGAPEDEYDSEAEEIAHEILLISHEQVSVEMIACIIYARWEQSFELSPEEMALRTPLIEDVSAQILR